MATQRASQERAAFGHGLRIAIRIGGGFGLIFAILAGILMALLGTEYLTPIGMSPATLMLVFVGGGVLGGAIVGILLPLAKRWALVAMLLGYAALFPYCLLIAFAVTQESSVSPFEIAPITSLAGAFAGWFIWKEEQRPAKRGVQRGA